MDGVEGVDIVVRAYLLPLKVCSRFGLMRRIGSGTIRHLAGMEIGLGVGLILIRH